MSKCNLRFLLPLAAAFAVAAAFMHPSVSYGVIITPADGTYDIWIRQSVPGTAYQDDGIWMSTDGFDGGQERKGVVQFNLSSVAVPITSATLGMAARGDGGDVTLAPAGWVNSSVLAGNVQSLTYGDYESSIQPSEVAFAQLGSATFPFIALPNGTYGITNFASAADLAVLNTIRTGDGIVTMIFTATSGAREFRDDSTYGGFQPFRLYINEIPPENPNLQLTVNRFTGATAIKNPAVGTPFNINGYSITSTAGSLVPDPTNTPGVGWDSITDSGGAGWEEVGPAATALSELNLTNSTAIAAGASRNLGKAFNISGERDLAFEYSILNGNVLSGSVVYSGGLELLVKRLIGNGGVPEGTKVVISNPEPLGIGIDGYVIESDAGSLDPVNFHGYDDANVPGWEEVDLSANAITELNLTSSSTVGAGGQRILANAFTTGATKDLTFEYNVAATGETVVGAPVKYADVLSGDANGDNKVDIFDVNVVSAQWASAGPGGDVNYDGIVDIFDVNVMSAHWGNMLMGGGGGGDAAAVPEPTALVLLSLGVLAMFVGRPRWRQK